MQWGLGSCLSSCHYCMIQLSQRLRYLVWVNAARRRHFCCAKVRGHLHRCGAALHLTVDPQLSDDMPSSPSSRNKPHARTPARSAAPAQRPWWKERLVTMPVIVIVLFIAFVIGIRLASSSFSPSAPTIDHLPCSTAPQSAAALAHVGITADGTSRTIPAGIGFVKPWSTNQGSEGTYSGTIVIGGTCVYPLTTQAPTGLVHILGKPNAHMTLAAFFAIWHQPLTADRAATWHGPVTIYVNGKRTSALPSAIRLTNHTAVDIVVGSPSAAPKPYTFPS